LGVCLTDSRDSIGKPVRLKFRRCAGAGQKEGRHPKQRSKLRFHVFLPENAQSLPLKMQRRAHGAAIYITNRSAWISHRLAVEHFVKGALTFETVIF
jgi:hypothetical protein